MHHLLPYSDSCLYWCLAYIREGISDLRIYVAVTSPYPPGSGRYRVVSEPRLYILSTSRRQVNGKGICNWNAWVLVIQSNYKCRVIYSFLIILPLIPNPFHLSPVLMFRSLYTNLRYGYTRRVVAGSEWNNYMISSANSVVLGYSQNWPTIGLSFRRRYSDFSITILYSWLYLSEWSMPGIWNS